MIRRARPFLLAALALAAAACGRASDDEVRVMVIDEEVAQRMLDAALAQGLVRFDAAGEIEQGLAASWHVSDDARSYIFRLADAEWRDGEPVAAPDVVRLLSERIADPRWADEFGAVADVRAMTDRVIEIRLTAPQQHFLQLLARPELAIGTQRAGTGPFTPLPSDGTAGARIGRLVETPRGDLVEERVLLQTRAPQVAVKAFGEGEADLVTGGTFATLPYAQDATGPFAAPRFDPVAGLFGLAPLEAEGAFATPEIRRALSAAIDRDALVAALGVRSLLPRATVLQAGLDMQVRPRPPAFVDMPLDERRALVRDRLDDAGLVGAEIAVELPSGPGADILFTRLVADWGAVGLVPVRAAAGTSADFALIDEVAPAASTSWFLRRFTCARAIACDPAVDTLLDEARTSTATARRNELLREASARIEEQQLFIPLAAPVRWSLVAPDLTGFAENRFARHFVGGLREKRRRR
ncbi:ABC transporter substrate-binding protein [Sphingomicrobium arenosum]|uniref:ABC transporter substrate-binding protein n=1 Tax=Sphingomicrobium arenosum TaxID=2233861 RepID=UPI002240D69D|nr:ABC transporter substrate-binding protein [Sphingomicrobium arenosum]